MIKKILTWFSWLYSNLERWLFYGLILVTGIAGTWFTYNYAVAFSDYFIVLLFVTIFFAIFDWFDTYILKSIDTIDEIKSGNTAVSQFLVAIALLVLAAAITVG